MANHYIGIVGKARADNFIKAGALELGRGGAGDLAGLMPGDGIAIYAPRVSRIAAEPLQAFTAIGRITGHLPHREEIAPGVFRHRLLTDWKEVQGDASIRPLVAQLDLTTRYGPRWGQVLRRDIVPINEDDFFRIASALGAVPPI